MAQAWATPPFPPPRWSWSCVSVHISVCPQVFMYVCLPAPPCGVGCGGVVYVYMINMLFIYVCPQVFMYVCLPAPPCGVGCGGGVDVYMINMLFIYVCIYIYICTYIYI